MKIKEVNFLFIFLTTILATSLFAKPAVNIKKKYYSVVGFSENEIRKSMNKQRKKYTGANYDAYTKWDVRWDYRWKKLNGICKIFKINTKVDVTFILPKLLNKNKINNILLKKWERYKKASIKHEYGHRDFGVNSAKKIEEILMKMTSSNCKNLEKKANKKAKNIINQFVQKEIEYDKKTTHGINDGAVFPNTKEEKE